MHVLITNDDGYMAPGIAALVRAVELLGWGGTVVAPASAMSGSSRSRHSGLACQWTRAEQIGPVEVIYVDATPAACVIFALTSGLAGQFDLCMSGVNAGENLGADVTASGTFGAALEAASYGVPAIAISRQYEQYFSDPLGWDWSWVAAATARHVRRIVDAGSAWRLANVNLPNAGYFEDAVFASVSRESYFHDSFDCETSRLVTEVDYDRARVKKSDDIHVFAELERVSISLLTGVFR